MVKGEGVEHRLIKDGDETVLDVTIRHGFTVAGIWIIYYTHT
jgi:hypothetical protein